MLGQISCFLWAILEAADQKCFVQAELILSSSVLGYVISKI
jgi:hypothetical protein